MGGFAVAVVEFGTVAEDADSWADVVARTILVIENRYEMSVIGKILNGEVGPVLRNDWRDLREIIGTGDDS